MIVCWQGRDGILAVIYFVSHILAAMGMVVASGLELTSHPVHGSLGKSRKPNITPLELS